MSENNSWIRETAEKYYKDGWFKNSKFRKTAFGNGDHDHCCIDFKKISQTDYDESEKQGYYSSIDGTWFCTTCFEEYAKHRKLPVVKNTVQMVKDALNEHKTVVISLNNEQYFIKNNGKITVEHNGSTKEYDSINAMEREQMFYGKPIREAIDDIYLGIID